jgi:diacylglycerol kinase (ATP)
LGIADRASRRIGVFCYSEMGRLYGPDQREVAAKSFLGCVFFPSDLAVRSAVDLARPECEAAYREISWLIMSKNEPASVRSIEGDSRQVLVLVNRSAGARSDPQLVEKLQNHLQAVGLDAEIATSLGQLDALLAERGPHVWRAVVAAGGDGTLSAVVNRLPNHVPIAVLPLGTENLMAKYLGQARDISQLCDRIIRGQTVQLDAGLADDRLFLLMVGVGFDAEVVRRLDEIRHGHIRHWSYVKPILASLRSYGYPAFRLKYREAPLAATGEPDAELCQPTIPDDPAMVARWAFVVNLPCYAGGLGFVPEAIGTDGMLDVCTFRRGSWVQGVRYLTHVVLGRHGQLADVDICQAAALRIESDHQVPYQLDGDPGGWLPVDIRTLPGRVRLVVDPDWALQKGFLPPGAVEVD